jgi:uncharacterized protein YndB with AHSA1/START domain
MTATARVDNGVITASIDIAVPPDVVFRAISSPEITQWWGSDEMYRVVKWTGDVRPGGTWQADTKAAGDGPEMIVRGKFLVVDPPRVLEHTWEPSWENFLSTTVRYTLTPTPSGTRVEVRHSGFAEAAAAGQDHAEGWMRVLNWLEEHFGK